VAKCIGVSVATVVNWERNRFVPELRYLPAIVAFLGYDPRPKAAANSLPERLISRRLKHGLTQKAVAEILKVAPCTISSWERSSSRPPLEYRTRIDELLDEGKDDAGKTAFRE
jgi:transcriptional regulator with XRE-family HTH domain